MDWARAIERNRETLEGIVAALFALLGGAAERVPRGLYLAAVRVLGPTESAVRRLIVIAARGLEVEPSRSRVMVKRPAGRGTPTRLAFRLFDRRKRFALGPPRHGPRLEPRIHVFGGDPRIALFRPPSPPEPVSAIPLDDGLADARRLRMRLEAVALALGDLPRQARRLVRWRAKRERLPGFKFRSPLRPGPPPGHRKKPVHEIDFVLTECHGLAFDALAPNTS